MRISAKTDIGRSRAENQDDYRSGVFPNGVVWGIVCDGMGGGQDGKLASSLASDCIEDRLFTGLQDTPPDKAIKKLMEDAVQCANAEIFERSGRGSIVMGTTVVCAAVRNGVAHIAHVGDSRAYLWQQGELRQLTHDHSMVQEMVDQGFISPDEAVHHPDKNVITRALGVDGTLKVEYTTQALQPGAILLLCTDGLTNMVSDERVNQIMGNFDFYDMGSELVNEALLEGGGDNITVLLMQPREPGKDV